MKRKLLKLNINKNNFSKIIATVVCIFFSFTFFLICVEITGNSSILDYINQTISPIQKRQLEFGIDSNGFSYVKNNDDSVPIKVLQLTDIHLACSIVSYNKDKLAINAITQLVNNTKPDIIVLPGDNIYPSFYRTLSVNNKLMAHALARIFEGFEIPWALVYGNHDAEGLAVWDKTQLSTFFSSLDYCLFQRGPENITGQGNYFVKILNQSGEIVSALSLLDSNSMIAPLKYDNIHQDQINFYTQTLSTLKNSDNQIVPSYMYIHIPLNEYDIAWQKYIDGSDEVKYYFGKKDWWRICDPDIPGKIFDAIVSLGSTKAVFCGHDHTNTFSIDYKGIRLTYGMSIDYIAYVGMKNKTSQRGGTILEISMYDGSGEIYQVPQDNNFFPVNK